MPPLVCPNCRTETSQGAYVCHRCGFSYVHEQSKPYFRRMLSFCLALCLVSFVVWMLALRATSEVSFAAVTGFAMWHAIPGVYFINRLRGKFATLGDGLHVKPGRNGWVAVDFLALLSVCIQLLVGLATFP